MTFTKEQLFNQARENVKALKMAVVQTAFKDIRPEIELDLALAEMALAGMEAEPVTWKVAFKLEGQPGSNFDKIFESRQAMNDAVSLHEQGGFIVSVTPIYTAPQPLTTSERAELENYRNAEFMPKNLDRALTIMGVALPESKEEFNFQAERWMQRLIDRVIRCESEWNAQQVVLTVWYGAMPESNGKTNWTAILHRKGHRPWEGITIDRSEYPGRTLYEADRMRFLIGEISEEPDCLAYDADEHSGYIAPQSGAVKDGWVACSERMPETGDDMIVFTDEIVMSGISYSKKKGFYIQALEYDDDEPVDNVTHWQPLPAAPQQQEAE